MMEYKLFESFEEWKAAYERGPAAPEAATAISTSNSKTKASTEQPALTAQIVLHGQITPFEKLPNELTDEILELAVTYPRPILVSAQHFEPIPYDYWSTCRPEVPTTSPLDIRAKLPAIGRTDCLQRTMRQLYRNNTICLVVDDLSKTVVLNSFPNCSTDPAHDDGTRGNMAVQEIRSLVLRTSRAGTMVNCVRVLPHFRGLEKLVLDMRCVDYEGADGMLSYELEEFEWIYKPIRDSRGRKYTKGGQLKMGYRKGKSLGMQPGYFEFEAGQGLVDALEVGGASVGMENGGWGVKAGTVFIAVDKPEEKDDRESGLLMQIKICLDGIFNDRR